MTWLRVLGLVVAALVVIGVVAIAYSSARWSALTAELKARLESARVTPRLTRFDEAELVDLPAPVQRFFRAALPLGAPLVTAVVIEHRGTFNMGEARDQWRPFRSAQRVVLHRPGFVWDGRVDLLPGVDVRVHDAYVAGEGILHPTIAGLITLADLRGGGQVAEDELLRFFAEAAWYPTALLPSQGVSWEAIDDRSARATLRDGALSGTLTFVFRADGLIESVRADARGRMVSGEIVPTPWEGRWTNYESRSGMRVPIAGEVAWLLADGAKPYWRGTITALTYEFAR